jgi:hypothetical protein
MRRGLISWSRQEVPVEVLEQRVARLQQAMRREGLDAVLAHTSIARPSAVSWLTQFVPYFNEGLLVIPARGGPTLLAAFSKRVQEWIREVSYLEDVVTAPRPGEAVVALLARRIPDFAGRGAKVGIVELDEFPWSIAEPMVQGLGQAAIVDAGALFASVRQPADEAEIGLARRALAIATRALDAIPAGTGQASAALAAADRSARLEGAEEVLFRVAPDLAKSPVLQRIETDAALAGRWALQLSVAYKGVWVRTARCHGGGAASDAAASWFAKAAGRLGSSAPDTDAPGKLVLWTLEACLGTHPLSVVAHGPARMQQAVIAPSKALPPGALAVFCAQLELSDGTWHGAVPVITGGAGKPARVLTPAPGES